jgi:hypothetical protein
VIRLSDRVEFDPRPAVALDGVTEESDWVVSRHGTITAADVKVGAFTAVSVYSLWERTAYNIFADGSAHRILSDLSALMPSPNHRLLVAGDWNILFGYGEHGDSYWKDRYRTVFDRDSPSSGHSIRTVGKQNRGPTSCRSTVAVCRRFTTANRHRRRPLDSWTSYSCHTRWLTPSLRAFHEQTR